MRVCRTYLVSVGLLLATVNGCRSSTQSVGAYLSHLDEQASRQVDDPAIAQALGVLASRTDDLPMLSRLQWHGQRLLAFRRISMRGHAVDREVELSTHSADVGTIDYLVFHVMDGRVNCISNLSIEIQPGEIRRHMVPPFSAMEAMQAVPGRHLRVDIEPSGSSTADQRLRAMLAVIEAMTNVRSGGARVHSPQRSWDSIDIIVITQVADGVAQQWIGINGFTVDSEPDALAEAMLDLYHNAITSLVPY